MLFLFLKNVIPFLPHQDKSLNILYLKKVQKPYLIYADIVRLIYHLLLKDHLYKMRQYYLKNLYFLEQIVKTHSVYQVKK